MKDEELFRDKFRLIAFNLSSRFIGYFREFTDKVHDEIVNEIISDIDTSVYGIDDLIAGYKEGARQYSYEYPDESNSDKYRRHFRVEAYRITAKYLKELKKDTTEKPSVPAKYYALYHWIKIELGMENQFEKDDLGQWPRKKIEEYAAIKYPGINANSFYKEFKGINIKNKASIANSFGRGYKDKVKKASNNDAQIINALRDFPK